MHNHYQSRSAILTKTKQETTGIKRFWFEFADKEGKQIIKDCQPGQIIELWIPGYGEAPFAPCQKPNEALLELCVRKAGHVTSKLHELKKRDRVGIRGPIGHGWPTKTAAGEWQMADSRWAGQKLKENLLIVVGGLGLIPTRNFVEGAKQFWPKGKIQLFYGAKSPEEMLFREEFERWKKGGIDVQLTIDQVCVDWKGCTGVVTQLFNYATCVENANAFLVGPPIMYKFVLEELKKHCFEDQDIFMSLERRMHCGVGTCQHCAVGPYYTCKDGPVFRYDEIKNIKDAL